MANKNLTNAKRVKNDEFYTQYSDIQKEIEAYLEYSPDVFRGKVVYCNCDDPFESNFFKYFATNFNALKLMNHDRGFEYSYHIESCWSWMKRRLFKQYHHFTKRYAPEYVQELTWHFNTRKSDKNPLKYLNKLT